MQFRDGDELSADAQSDSHDRLVAAVVHLELEEVREAESRKAAFASAALQPDARWQQQQVARANAHSSHAPVKVARPAAASASHSDNSASVLFVATSDEGDDTRQHNGGQTATTGDDLVAGKP